MTLSAVVNHGKADNLNTRSKNQRVPVIC